MPKPGIKYFIGSFLLSLVAVFAAAKTYLLFTLSEQQQEQTVASVKARNIELFAVNEEEDPIYNKFKEVSQPSNPLQTAESDEISISDTNSDEVLYAPEEDTTTGETLTDNSTQSDANAVVALSDDNDLAIVDSAEFVEPEEKTEAKSEDENKDEELEIADAAQAPTFAIPLKHNYNIEGGTVTVSDSTGSEQIALASHDVSIYNLGTANQADVTEPLPEKSQEEDESTQSAETTADAASSVTDDDVWEVAETANKHVAKNSLSVKSPQEEADIALPAQEVQTAYKPQQNILIPIPDDIMNEENLTPQFSSSKENLELERELRAKNKLPQTETDKESGAATSSGATSSGKNSDGSTGAQSPADGSSSGGKKIEIKPIPAQIPADDSEKDFDEKNESNADDSTSKSLTDSITAWFSGVKTKAANLKSSVSSSTAKGADAQNAEASKKTGGSIFQRLLGPQEEEKNIAPSELKITFQPNKAEISGQTLEWLRAFADNTIKHDTVVVEIRASETAPQTIQHKRLKLLYKLLEDTGVSYHKINTIFTNREPNSFIIRNVRYASEEDMVKAVVKWGDNPW